MAWILDIVFFVVLLIGTFVGAGMGFVRGASKIAGWVLSFIIPFTFCMAFKDALQNWFGLETLIAEGVKNATLGSWITVAISYVGLFIIVKLGTLLIGLLGTALIERFKGIAVVNSILGALLSLCETFLLILLVLLICSWLPIEGMHNFINSSFVVGPIFRSNLIGLLPGLIRR